MAIYCGVKVKFSRYRSGVAQRVGTVIALLFYDRGTRRGWVFSSTPQPHSTPGKDPVLFLYRRLGGLQGRSGRAENLVTTGIRSRTIKTVVSRYTDWATQPTYGKQAYYLLNISDLFGVKPGGIHNKEYLHENI